MPQTTEAYRFSLLDVVGKTFERVLHKRIMKFLIRFQKLDDNQNGFRPARGTEMHLMTLDETLLAAGQDLPVCFMDIKKAFPTVRRSSRDVVQGAVWKIIHSMYDHRTGYPPHLRFFSSGEVLTGDLSRRFPGRVCGWRTVSARRGRSIEHPFRLKPYHVRCVWCHILRGIVPTVTFF